MCGGEAFLQWIDPAATKDALDVIVLKRTLTKRHALGSIALERVHRRVEANYGFFYPGAYVQQTVGPNVRLLRYRAVQRSALRTIGNGQTSI